MVLATVADLTPGAADYLAYAQGGDVAMLERALQACAGAAYTQARRHLGNAADADDAVQEAFLQLTRTARRFDGSVPFAAWVGRLVRVACLRVRHRDRQRKRREVLAMATPSSECQPEDRIEQVRDSVARLPEADQAVINLHYFAGLSQAEVAAALGSSENTVAQRLSRARARLRTLLGRREMTATVVASLLAAQPAYAAPPQVAAGMGSLCATVTAGGVLPATSIPLSWSQKGLLLMSLHPISTLLCAGLLAVAAILPAVLWSAEPPPPKPAPVPAQAAGEQPWQGKARELLPFMDPDAQARMAVDWAFLRGQALTTKPTSLLADPRAQPALAHMREQFRLWQRHGAMPDWGALIAHAEGSVFAIGRGDRPHYSLVAELGEDGARDMQRCVEEGLPRSADRAKDFQTVRVGPFKGFVDQLVGVVVAQSGGRWVYSHQQALQSGLDRRTVQTPPSVPLWLRLDKTDTIATLASLDRDRSDPMGLATWLGPAWRTAKPVITSALSRHDGVWRTTTSCDGSIALPLRPVAATIAGCVPNGALASLVLGVDPTRFTALVEGFGQIASVVPPERLIDWLSGDVAVVVQAQAPIPAMTVVLGLRPGVAEAVQKTLAASLPRLGMASISAASGALAAWGGATPIGLCQLHLAGDRLVASTGEAAAFITNPARPITESLALDLDLPTLARSYLPLLYAMIPTKPIQVENLSVIHRFIEDIANVMMEVRIGRVVVPESGIPLNLDTVTVGGGDGGMEKNGVSYAEPAQAISRMRASWQRLAGNADLPIGPHVAVYHSVDRKAVNGGYSTTTKEVVVFRTVDGWQVIDSQPYYRTSFTTLTEVERRLAGLEFTGGTVPGQLQRLTLPEDPTFDQRWVPPVQVVADHLPPYRLRVSSTPAGMEMVEDGLPLMVFVESMWVWMREVSEEQGLQRQYGQALYRRDGPAMKAKHQRAIEALIKVNQILDKRLPEAAPLMSPSQMLAAAQVPLAELASLTNGVVPTAERIDALGFWHPPQWPRHTCRWLIPLEGGLFIETPVTFGLGVSVTGTPYLEKRQATPEEQAKMLQEWQSHKASQSPPESEPQTPAKPGEF